MHRILTLLFAVVALAADCSAQRPPVGARGDDSGGTRLLMVTEWRRWKDAGHTTRDAARRGGWINTVIGGVGQHFGRLDREELADTREIRALAAQFGTEIRVLTRWRADVIGCDTRTGCDREGFQPAWLRTVPAGHPAVADLREWTRAGYTIGPSEYMDANWWGRVLAGIPPGRHYIPYAEVDPKARRVKFRKVAADLCNVDYRAWAVAHARWQMKETGADALLMTNKWYFWPAPQAWHQRPGQLRWGGGGVITDTPYGPGEYEACFAALIRELAANSIPVVLNTNGGPAGKEWDWMPPDVRRLVVGEERVWH